MAYELLMVNSYFKKKEDHLVTFKSSSIKIQIDYFLIRANNRRLCKDCEVIPNEYLGTQHRLIVLDVEFKYSKWKTRSVGDPRVKWWNLMKENAMKSRERITEEGAWRQVEDADTIWDTMAECIRRSIKKILGTSKGCGSKIKGVWWWNDEAKEKVKEKKKTYAVFGNSETNEEKEISRVRYKTAKKAAKKAVVVAKTKAYDKLYQKLETKKGEKEVFKLARVRERRTGDLDHVRCIKGENGKVLSKDPETRRDGKCIFSNSSMAKCWKIFGVGNGRVVKGNLIPIV